MKRPTAEDLHAWDCHNCKGANTKGRKTCGWCGMPRRATADSIPPLFAPDPMPNTAGTQTGRAGAAKAPFGKCPHTGRPYRSKTEARWAAEYPEHRYEALAIATPCGMYWPDFVEDCHREGNMCLQTRLVEVKGAFIRDRALHKVKAAIRPARALGFAGIWLAQWKDGKWSVSEITEG